MKLIRLLQLTLGLFLVAATARAENDIPAPVSTNSAPKANAASVAAPSRPSLILIACQGLALGDLSCYGQTNFQTPNLDRLAAEGVRFTDYRAGGDDLAHGQAALLGGSPGASTVDDNALPVRLKQAGYATGLVGEWVVSPEPQKQGFDEFVGFLSEAEANDFYSDSIWRYTQNRIREATGFVYSPRFGREAIFENMNGKKGEYLPDYYFGMIRGLIRINKPDPGNHFRPFFFLATLPVPRTVVPGKDVYPVPTDAPFSGEKWPPAAKNRAALLTRLDNSVGQLLQQLQEEGLTNNVAIVLAGAVAPPKFTDRQLDFLQLPDEVRGGTAPEHLRTPLIIRWPHVLPAGRIVSTPCTAADLAPTALDLALLPASNQYPGHSLLSAIRN